jgi:hypothetical protein
VGARRSGRRLTGFRDRLVRDAARVHYRNIGRAVELVVPVGKQALA